MPGLGLIIGVSFILAHAIVGPCARYLWWMDRKYNCAHHPKRIQPTKSVSVAKEDDVALISHGRASSKTRWSSIRTDATSMTSWRWSSARTDITRWSSATTGKEMFMFFHIYLVWDASRKNRGYPDCTMLVLNVPVEQGCSPLNFALQCVCAPNCVFSVTT